MGGWELLTRGSAQQNGFTLLVGIAQNCLQEPMNGRLYSHLSLNCFMALVVDQRKIIHDEVINSCLVSIPDR